MVKNQCVCVLSCKLMDLLWGQRHGQGHRDIYSEMLDQPHSCFLSQVDTSHIFMSMCPLSLSTLKCPLSSTVQSPPCCPSVRQCRRTGPLSEIPLLVFGVSQLSTATWWSWFDGTWAQRQAGLVVQHQEFRLWGQVWDRTNTQVKSPLTVTAESHLTCLLPITWSSIISTCF